MPVRLDYETFSEADLKKVGMFRYARHPSTEILCLAYKIDKYPTALWRPGLALPRELCERIAGGDTIHAFNAGFEYLITTAPAGQRIGLPIPKLTQMRDTAARAASLALPRKMENCAKVLRLPIQKDLAGHRVMMKLTRPRKPTITDSSMRWTPHNATLDFGKLYEYCINDVDTEAGIDDFLGPLSDYEQAIWELDFIINDRGVPIDVAMARNVIKMRDEYMGRLIKRCIDLCGYTPSQTAQLLKWINTTNIFQIPVPDARGIIKYGSLPSLDKDNVTLALSAIKAGRAFKTPNIADLLVSPGDPIDEILRIRQQTSQTSLKKFDTLLEAMDSDGRIRGMFLYWGAGPGRWAGRIAQLHNLKKPVIGNSHSKEFKKANKGFNLPVELARIVSKIDLPMLEMLYEKPMDALSSIIRPVIKAEPDKNLLVLDYSSVESRILSWQSGEQWRLDVFNSHGRIYEATASKLTGIPFEEIEEDSKERQAGKVCELALGYQGANGALIKMGAIEKYGLKYKDLKPLVKTWRTANPKIVEMWYGVDAAVMQAMQTGRVIEAYRCRFGIDPVKKMFFHIQLPSGRMLTYVYPRLRTKVRVWNEDLDRFEDFHPERHNQLPHDRTRQDPDTGVWENYLHPGFKPQNMTQFVFEGEDSLTRQWVLQDAYGGKFVENIVQGIGACLLRTGLLNTERAGYQNILHVHDEGGAEGYLRGRGPIGQPLLELGEESVNHYAELFCKADPWAEGLPLKAKGYLAPEYHKD